MTLAWHFTRLDCRLGYGDGRLVVAGETLTHDGPVKLCSSGLHASVSLLDALGHASGPYLWRVKCSGEVIKGDDKLVCTERTAIAGFDASEMLRDFARRCALDVVNLWDAPDVVIRYLKTGDKSIRAAARAAAWDAAWAAAWDALAPTVTHLQAEAAAFLVRLCEMQDVQS